MKVSDESHSDNMDSSHLHASQSSLTNETVMQDAKPIQSDERKNESSEGKKRNAYIVKHPFEWQTISNQSRLGIFPTLNLYSCYF